MSTKKVRVVHYLNHFFAGVGGEEQAGTGVNTKNGPVGPARGLQQEFGESAEVIATIFCGDNHFAEAPEDAKHEIVAFVKSMNPDVLVAGPAFNAGRYGFACAEVCHAVASELDIPCVTGLYPGNPGTEVYRQYRDRNVYAIPTGDTAAGMGEALKQSARLALRIATGDSIGHAEAEGYIGRGLRLESEVDRPGAERAVDMILAKINHTEFKTEIPIVKFDDVVAAAPLTNIAGATIALVSTSGVLPKGNPDGFKAGNNTFWRSYSIEGINRLDPGQWEAYHSGYHTAFMNQDPHYGVPLDVLRELEDSQAIGRLHSSAYLFPGGSMEYSVAKQLGEEIADDLKQSNVDGVILVST